MIMRALASELPIAMDAVSVEIGGVRILDDINFTFTPGEPTVLIGPNGSGKTTLLRVAMGLQSPSAGRVTWSGVERVPPARRAIVFQRPVMLRRTAAGNLRYALAAAGISRPRREERVTELLKIVGLAELGERPARRMSGGEQQRLALARALARDPHILFLDEPGASLDPAAAKAVEDVIRTVVARGIKVVMTTHDLGAAKRLAGDIVFMHRGRILETGSAAEFFQAQKTGEARTFVAGELVI
jgi:tungstate transport system ATP-binding protein